MVTMPLIVGSRNNPRRRNGSLESKRERTMTKATQLDRWAFISFRSVNDICMSKMAEEIRTNESLKGCHASEWVHGTRVVEMSATWSRPVTFPRLRRLVELGWIESRSTSGFGLEYRITDAERIENQQASERRHREYTTSAELYESEQLTDHMNAVVAILESPTV